jgi:hypothetical protein
MEARTPRRDADVSTPENEEIPDRSGIRGGRYWDRTSDLFRVREARYRCANRPSRERFLGLEVDTGFEPVYTALQAAASPLGQSTVSGFTTKRTGIGLSPDPDQSG